MRNLIKTIIGIFILMVLTPVTNVLAIDVSPIQDTSDVEEYVSRFESIDDYFFNFIITENDETDSIRIILNNIKLGMLNELQNDAYLVESTFYLYESGSEAEGVALNYLETLSFETREIEKITTRMDELISLDQSVRDMDELRELSGLMIDLKFIFVNRFSEDGYEKQSLYSLLDREYNYK